MKIITITKSKCNNYCKLLIINNKCCIGKVTLQEVEGAVMNTKQYIYLALFFGLGSMDASAEFMGKLVLEPREKPLYEVMENFSYKDKKGIVWTTTKGYKTNGASIPRLLWPVIGDPYGGGYIKSAVIHDQACDEKKRTWQDTHRVFFDAMLEEGVSPTRAYIMYAAVYRYGPKWELKTISFNKKPKFQMNQSACPMCKVVETLSIDETETLRIIPVDIQSTGELTGEKLRSIEREVQRLEASGPIKVKDLEDLKID